MQSLLTIVAEISLSAGNWRGAYRDACAVLAADPDDYRALIVISAAAYQIGNIHEALGHALAARLLRKGSLPAILQLLRCRNRLGNHYAALAAFDTLSDKALASADIHVELGKAYQGLDDLDRAVAEYRAALALGTRSAAAVRALLGIYAAGGRNTELDALIASYPASAQKVAHRENRCVLFDSRLIHITDEMHFKPGYENRRVNVTLLYGKARGIG